MNNPTGIVRRIDDLGRVVIPKEIRRSMNLVEGDPLEIVADPKSGCITLKKNDALRPIHELLFIVRQRISEEENLKNKAAMIEKVKELSAMLSVEDKGVTA